METATKQTFLELLNTHYACDDAIVWIEESGHTDLPSAWETCERPDWILWLCGRMAGKDGWPTRQQIVLVACEIARGVLYLAREQDHEVCRKAIEAAEAWAHGTGTIVDVLAARCAADAAAAAAYAAYAACDAACAAAYAAYAACDAACAAADAAADAADAAAYAAYAAAYAAYAAADAAYAADARQSKRLEICALIRERFDLSNASW